MYATSSLLYYSFAQSKSARAVYLQLTGDGKPHKRLRSLYTCIETGRLPARHYDALLMLGIERETIEHALAETHRQRAEEARRVFRPSLTALFERDAEPAGSRTTAMARTFACKVTVPENVITYPWAGQLADLKARIERHRQYLAETFSPAAQARHLGELTGYAYRPDPDCTVLLTVDGELMEMAGTPSPLLLSS